MFLWARLVTDLLSSGGFFSAEEMRKTVDEMPKELAAL